MQEIIVEGLSRAATITDVAENRDIKSWFKSWFTGGSVVQDLTTAFAMATALA